MFNWIKELFWKRCSYCKKKKELFYYTWEVPDVPYVPGVIDQEICTDCANKRIHYTPFEFQEPMTEKHHNEFGVFKNGFGSFDYILPTSRNICLKVIFTEDYIWLKQQGINSSKENNDMIAIWNKDLTRRDISVQEWKDLYFLLTGEQLTVTQTI